MRFGKGGVARAGCRRRGRAGGNRSGAADLAAVLVTCHRRGVAGRWRRVGEKIALEDDRLDAVIAKLELSVEPPPVADGRGRPTSRGHHRSQALWANAHLLTTRLESCPTAAAAGALGSGLRGQPVSLPPRRTVGPAQDAHLAPSQLRHEEGPGDSHVEAATLSGDPI